MLDETICHQVFVFTTPKTILKSKFFALIASDCCCYPPILWSNSNQQILSSNSLHLFCTEFWVSNTDMFPSIKQFGLQVKLLGMLPPILWSSSNQQIVNSNSLYRFCTAFWVSNMYKHVGLKVIFFIGSIKRLDSQVSNSLDYNSSFYGC